MTTTITPEEREQWRRETELPSYAIRQEHRRIVRLLEALETAEKERDFLAWVSQPLADLYQEEMSRADKAESERDWLFANVNRACPPEKLRFIDCGEVRENENYPCRRCWQSWSV